MLSVVAPAAAYKCIMSHKVLNFKLLSLLAAITLVLGACGTPATPTQTQATSEPPTAPAAASTVAPTAAPAAAATKAPIIFTAAIQFEIANADPAVTTDWPGGLARRTLYDTLIELHGDPVAVQPGLAQKWEVSNDLTQWTFHLTDKAVFHDGSPVTAAAVKYSFDRQMAMKTGFAWLWQDITDQNSVNAVDDHTVSFKLTKPFAPFLQTLGYLAIVNPAVAKANEQGGDWAAKWMVDHEAGSGPYTISRWEPGSLYEFNRFHKYWKPFPHDTSPDVFRYVVYSQPGPAALGLQSGDVSWASYIEEAEAKQLEASGVAKTIIRRSTDVDYILMNTASKGPTGDPNVRTALAYAFKYAGVASSVFGMQPTKTIISGGLPGAVEFPDVQVTDLDKAKQYLAKSAWPNGGFALNYVYIGGFAPEETAGLILIDSLQALNIKVNEVPKTWTEMVKDCGARDTTPDMINIYFGAVYPDPYATLYQSFGPTTVYDYNTCSWYFDPKVAQLLQQSASEPSQDKRNQIYAQVQQILWDARFGILLGNSAHVEARSIHWNADEFEPMFGYIGYVQDYYYIP